MCNISIGFEGGVAAGKSTTSEILASWGFRHIPEYMTHLDPSRHCEIGSWEPGFRLNFFSNIEKRRKGEIKNVSRYLLDRTFLTVFAHDYARIKMGANVEIDCYSKLEFEQICWPKKIVFLSCTEADRMQRLSERGALFDMYLADLQFNLENENFFRQMESVVSIQWINSSNYTPTEIANLVTSKSQSAIQDSIGSREIFQSALKVLQNA